MQARRAFTIIELLVVVGIIVTLVGLLIVAVSRSAKASQEASTRSLMATVSRGLTQFRTDLGYLPPVLGYPSSGPSSEGTVGYLRDLVLPPTSSASPSSQQVAVLQSYYSMTSMIEYLLGPGGRDQDGFGAVGIPLGGTAGMKEMPPVGIRSPLKDGVWGAFSNPRTGSTGALGNFSRRNLPQGNGANTSTLPNVSGRSLGPYLELKDGSLLGAIVGSDSSGLPIVARAGDNNWRSDAPKVLLDYYGQPIRYYRRGYSDGDPRRVGGKQVGGGGGVGIGWDLSDIFVLRPQRFAPNTEVDGLPDGNGDSTTSRLLQMSDFALFSSGPDQLANFGVRADAAGLNADNVVEVGN